ncbi:MAG: transglutaminase family protein [Planctomycetia bacterium]|nr:transglutaminase family protein [Planctomycetia bacterium]
MAILVALNHVTHYRYDRPVTLSPQMVRLRPAPHTRTPIRSYSMRVLPAKHFVNWQQDPYANYQARLVFPELTREFRVEVDLVAEMTVINPFDFFLEPEAENYPFAYDPSLKRELAPYLEAAAPGPLLAELIKSCQRKDLRTADFLVEINTKINHLLKYLIRLEPGVQSVEETLTSRTGSCRDFAWLLVNLFRHCGLAARFVSGYLIQLTADVKSLDGPSGPEKDFTDLHAWVEVFLPGAGWVGLDATSGLFTGEGHIPLACTAVPSSAAPITGAVDECEAEFEFSMSVRRVREDPRVTKPYTDEQWKSIESLGHTVDAILKRQDVRLTTGGEPTFVSIDDVDAPEWNTTAQGTQKRQLAGQLIKRLHRRFARGGLLHYGIGKWYPGESLPRWALACYWRKDGRPIWNDPKLIADDGDQHHHTDRTAQNFLRTLTDRLRGDVSFAHALPGFEDVWYYLWKERRLPVNVDPLQNNLKNPEDRLRMAKIFEQGLDKVIGYVLPLRPIGAPGEGIWQTGAWFLRPERLYLIPGDSPMGLRLPLDSLPWVADSQYPHVYPRDPMERLSELPDVHGGQRYRRGQPEPGNVTYFREQDWKLAEEGVGPALEEYRRRIRENPSWKPELGRSAPYVIRTAICVEPRNGTLHIFMPPVRYIEDYLDLVARIEETAAELNTPLIIEGYTPPHDPRVKHLKVTPDPGVIEVNVQPVNSWDEAVSVTTGLYEDAHFSRLGTEKFMLDGRHSGTGGGNHIVIGGDTPGDSPFLRRPDLLKSLVAYWHNHPSLSYLFSGLFIGPTSQAPRADEGRPEMIYELDIALKEIQRQQGVTTPPWLVDRVFRNLLIDLTGNTHRAEFCIDKLYSPDSSSGRLGLVEFRGFEMPPHARMSLTQQLLLRTLIAKSWEKPYESPLVRWGTELHDRFMLPHYVADDFNEVLRDASSTGLDLKADWFAPHFEFRFPLVGEIDSVAAGGMKLEFRQAIEPWNVLGEEPAGGGTVRFVDSSVERLQIKACGMINTRHQIAVNGVLLPQHGTGRNGEFVSAVRYRAWQPAACLHPTIGVHTPLVFDVVDTWNHQAVAGCSYHVSHPGGRSFEQFPVNAFEAESRRMARFVKFGHTPGVIRPRKLDPSLEFPLTLDLRRCT